jgi:hypothetical protein
VCLLLLGALFVSMEDHLLATYSVYLIHNTAVDAEVSFLVDGLKKAVPDTI